ncbi:MAG: threonine synthase [Kiritimatiellae bacterium]|nr:threonine synthase [Kiritimatiellia bacterium]
MKYVSTRNRLEADAVETVFRGLAPDGGLYVPEKIEKGRFEGVSSLGEAEERVLESLFGDFPESVRKEAVSRLLSRFPAGDGVPMADVGEYTVLELVHGPTGAFKDVALSMLPVFMRHSAAGRKVLVLTATSGDTGSAAMQGFAGVDGTEVVVFFPEVGTSRIQRLQMTTPSAPNVHAIAIRGNFDDAQAAVKRIFADRALAAEAEARGVYLTSANSINTGRLVPQIGYYVLASRRLLVRYGERRVCGKGITVVVPSGNFGNLLAAYYAKLLGCPVKRFVCASNVNDVLARFIKSGVYEPGGGFTITNSPSMDIKKSSNVERLVWLLSGGEDGDIENACAETARLMSDLEKTGRYELGAKAKEKLFASFESGSATPEETEEEMRRTRVESAYVLDPHTAVASCVARKLGLPRDGECVLVAATATPFKFPETCAKAFGADVLGEMPPSFAELEKLEVSQKTVIDVGMMPDTVRRFF